MTGPDRIVPPPSRPQPRSSQTWHRSKRWLSSFVVLILLMLAAGGCAWMPWTRAADDAAEPAEPGLEIERLQEAIREDHTKLEALVTSPQSDETEDVYRSKEVKVLAERLKLHRQALKRLEAQQRAARPSHR